MLIRRILTPFGWTLDEASDGIAGFEGLLLQSYDLLITDLQMSPMNGADMIDAIRLLPEWRRPRIIICSADAHAPPDRFTSAMRHADATISKPLDPRLLATEAVRLIQLERNPAFER